MDSNNHVAYSKEHIRFAVLSFFLAQGLCFSSWASRIPDIKEIFTVNDALYWGIVLFMIPVGKFAEVLCFFYSCLYLPAFKEINLNYGDHQNDDKKNYTFGASISIAAVVKCSVVNIKCN